MATPIFICGAECGIITVGATGLTPHWSRATGITISTTTFRNGLRAYRFNPSASTTYLKKNVSSTRVIGRVAFRLATLPVVDNVVLVGLDNASGTPIFRFDTGASKIEAIIGTGTAQASSMVIATNTWYILDFDVNSSGATATLDWKIDGVAQTQATNVQASANMTAFYIGLITIASSADVFFDDIILSYTAADYPFGDGKVLGFSPNVDGTHSFVANDFLYNAAGGSIPTDATDVYTYVDEVPITNGGDFINQAVINSVGYVEIGFADTTETTSARGLEVVCSQHSATTSANKAAMNLNDNDTISAVYPLTDISQTSLIFHSKQFATAPSTNLAWTQARINALKLRWGYSTDADPDAYLDAVILEIEWAVTAGGDVTITLAAVMSSTGASTTPASLVQADMGAVMVSTGAVASPTGIVTATPISVMGSTGTLTEPILSLSSAIQLAAVMASVGDILTPAFILQAIIESVMGASASIAEPTLSLSSIIELLGAMTSIGDMTIPASAIQAVVEAVMAANAVEEVPSATVQAVVASVMQVMADCTEPSLAISLTMQLLSEMLATSGAVEPTLSLSSLYNLLSAMVATAELLEPASTIMALPLSTMQASSLISEPALVSISKSLRYGKTIPLETIIITTKAGNRYGISAPSETSIITTKPPGSGRYG